MGDLAGALTDMRSYIEKIPDDAEYPNIHIWIIQMLQGNKAQADEELSAYVAKKPLMYQDEWIPNIASFFLNKIIEQVFLEAANVPDPKNEGKAWEGWYYAGIKRSLDGDKATAKKYFNKCAEIKKIDSKLLMVHVELELLSKATGSL